MFGQPATGSVFSTENKLFAGKKEDEKKESDGEEGSVQPDDEPPMYASDTQNVEIKGTFG